MIDRPGREKSPAKKRDCSPIYRLRFILALLLGTLVLSTGCAKQPPPPVALENPVVVAQKVDVVETARNNIGIPYKYGGTKPETGFDCSGLVCWSFAQVGVQVPRTAREQFKYGQRIEKAELQPGDIVLFKGTRSRSGWHSGIYSGEGKFIHSPTKGKSVMESSLDEKYFAQRFVGASRVPRDDSAKELYAAYLAEQRQAAAGKASGSRVKTKSPAKGSGKSAMVADARSKKPAAKPAPKAKQKKSTPLRAAAATPKGANDKQAAAVVDKLQATKKQAPATRTQARQNAPKPSGG